MPLLTTPMFSGAGAIAKYREAGPAVTVDAKLRLAPDIAEVSHAKVAISGGFESGDALQWVGEAGVVGSYNAVKGVLIFKGKASAATYAAILDSITFSATSIGSKTRTLTFTATSGAFTSAPVTTTVKVLSAPAAETFTASYASFDFAAASNLISGTSSAPDAGLALWTPGGEASQSLRLADPPSP